ANEQTGVVRRRIREDEGAAHRQIVDRCDARDRQHAAVPAPPVLEADPQLAKRERGAREHHELHEVAALDVLVLRPIDRKILAPGRLRLGRGVERWRAHAWGVVHHHTSTAENGSGSATTFNETARLRGFSSIAAVTSTCGATLASLRGTIMCTRV